MKQENQENTDPKVSYSENCSTMKNKEQRLRKGIFIQNIITHRAKGDILVDIGCSYGYITHCFVGCFQHVIGLDPDKQAVAIANSTKTAANCTFAVATAERIPLSGNSTDVVIANHIYEHVDNQCEMIEEIHRILKPDGIVYFTATNKYCLFEPHYRIPFFSWLAPKLQDVVLSIFHRPGLPYKIQLLSYNEIVSLVSKKFVVNDITLDVIKRYGRLYPVQSAVIRKFFMNPISSWILVGMTKLFFQVLPNYIFILEKNVNPRLEK